MGSWGHVVMGSWGHGVMGSWALNGNLILQYKMKLVPGTNKECFHSLYVYERMIYKKILKIPSHYAEVEVYPPEQTL